MASIGPESAEFMSGPAAFGGKGGAIAVFGALAGILGGAAASMGLAVLLDNGGGSIN